MFSSSGPEIPIPKEVDPKTLEEQPQRSRRMARIQNDKFIREALPKLAEEEAKWILEMEKMAETK